jgi:hypothetical protein
MGKYYVSAMRLGNIEGENNEQEFRTFQTACDELETEVQEILKD